MGQSNGVNIKGGSMKKWILALSLILLLALPAHAGQMRKTIIAETALTKGASEATVTLSTKGVDKMAVFFDYVPNSVEIIDITFDISYDGTNWMDANFFDYTSSAVPTWQETEALATEVWYYAYWNDIPPAPYLRVHIIGDTWTTTNSSATITVYSVQE